MAEGARLESVYTFARIEGSNPSLTAKILKTLIERLRSFFYAEHSYLDLAQSLLHKNDSSQNRIICTTK